MRSRAALGCLGLGASALVPLLALVVFLAYGQTQRFGPYVRAHKLGALITLSICFIGLLVIVVAYQRVKFYRTNVAGLEEFRSFSHMVLSRFGWGILGVVCIILVIAALNILGALLGLGWD